MAKRVFVSFDYDNDLGLKNLLVGQSRNSDSPFEVIDWSLKEAAPQKDWQQKALERIKRSDIVLVLVGSTTYRAPGVLKEVRMAQNEGVKRVQVTNLTNAHRVEDAGTLYKWTWENLKNILA